MSLKTVEQSPSLADPKLEELLKEEEKRAKMGKKSSPFFPAAPPFNVDDKIDEEKRAIKDVCYEQTWP